MRNASILLAVALSTLYVAVIVAPRSLSPVAGVTSDTDGDAKDCEIGASVPRQQLVSYLESARVQTTQNQPSPNGALQVPIRVTYPESWELYADNFLGQLSFISPKGKAQVAEANDELTQTNAPEWMNVHDDAFSEFSITDATVEEAAYAGKKVPTNLADLLCGNAGEYGFSDVIWLEGVDTPMITAVSGGEFALRTVLLADADWDIVAYSLADLDDLEMQKIFASISFTTAP